MTIFVGSTEVTDIVIGSTAINTVWVGATKLWERVLNDEQTITVGFLDGGGGIVDWGFRTTDATFGSTSDGTSDFASGASYLDIYQHKTTGTFNFNLLTVRVDALVPDSGWTTVTIGGVAYTRTSATYTQDAGATSWLLTIATDVYPFGQTIGATVTALFE